MAKTEKDTMLTAGKIAQATGASPALVKKAIAQLKLKPSAVKAGCSYYDAGAVKKIAAALK